MSHLTQTECSLGHTHFAVCKKPCGNKEKHQEHSWSEESNSFDPYTGHADVYGPYLCEGVEPWHEFKDGMVRKIGNYWYIRAEGQWWMILDRDVSMYQDVEMDALTKDGRIEVIV